MSLSGISDFLIKEHRRRSLNYDAATRLLRVPPPVIPGGDRSRIHKRNTRRTIPKLSILLLDWSCRERFDPLQWLAQQDVPRQDYELIWVELFDRVVPEVMEQVDVLVTCHQKAAYHKHEGYNTGLLVAQGELFCVCDSDAVFPRNFVRSILEHFYSQEPIPRGSVLFHFEGRSSLRYPGLTSADDLQVANWHWWGMHPNVGACMTVRTADAVRFGGFDEHPSYAGYLCGPYELGWRLINAGLVEVWHDPATMLWHFTHPDPVGDNGILPSLRQVREIVYPHVDLHALHAVESLACGRLQPFRENPAIFTRRMSSRAFGTEFVVRYAFAGPPAGFTAAQVGKMRRANERELLWIQVARTVAGLLLKIAGLLKPAYAAFVRNRRAWKPAASVYSIAGWVIHTQNENIFAVPHYIDPNNPEAGAPRITGPDFWSVQKAVLEQPPAWCWYPERIDTNFQESGHDIFAFLNLVIAVWPRDQQIDLGQLLLADPAGTYWGTTVASVRRMIEEREPHSGLFIRSDLFLSTMGDLLENAPRFPQGSPILVAILADLNLVYFEGQLLAVPHAVGRVEFRPGERYVNPHIRHITTRSELENTVNGQLQASGRVMS
jgi:hypothetical protein